MEAGHQGGRRRVCLAFGSPFGCKWIQEEVLVRIGRVVVETRQGRAHREDSNKLNHGGYLELFNAVPVDLW